VPPIPIRIRTDGQLLLGGLITAACDHGITHVDEFTDVRLVIELEEHILARSVELR